MTKTYNKTVVVLRVNGRHLLICTLLNKTDLEIRQKYNIKM